MEGGHICFEWLYLELNFSFKVILKSGEQLVSYIYIFGNHFLNSFSYITLRIQFGMTLSNSFTKPNIPSLFDAQALNV